MRIAFINVINAPTKASSWPPRPRPRLLIRGGASRVDNSIGGTRGKIIGTYRCVKQYDIIYILIGM